MTPEDARGHSQTWRDRPSYHLIRRFVSELFDPGFLSESGSIGTARAIGGVAAVLLSFGLLLARGFKTRYLLANDPMLGGGPDVYHHVALADHFFLIGATMWVVAFVTALIGSSLFPDETDFRVLMALPISRRLVFGAKLAALCCFTTIFVVISEAALLPLFGLTLYSPYLEHGVLALIAAYLLASLAGAVFAGLAVIALHATILLVVPRRILSSASAAVGSLLLFALVVSLPLIGRFTAMGPALEDGARWMFAIPPAWFAGLEQRLLGDARFGALALAGLGALAAVLMISAGTYLILYRHFERVMVRPAATKAGFLAGSVGRARDAGAWRGAKPERWPAFRAVRRFTALTLRRSPLHQGVLVAIAAVGAAIVVNSLIDIDFRMALAASTKAWRRRELVNAVIWAPFTLVFVTTLAVRSSLLVPIEPRANWVFRITERPAARLQQIDAAAWTMRAIGVVLPAIVLLPLQWFVMGASAWIPTGVAVLCGGVLVEVLFLEWRRIPFTCSYMVGKGFVPLVLLKGLLTFLLFTISGVGLAHAAWSAPPVVGLVIAAILISAIAGLRHLRRMSQEHVPLEFEDSLPTEVSPLGLTGD